jgi:hypothetical protein
LEIDTPISTFFSDSSTTQIIMRKHLFSPQLDPLGVKTGIELVAGGIVALVLMRWLGMWG